MSSFDYVIQGVKCTDARWADDPTAAFPGAWHLRTDTALLPQFPGLRATRFTRPGQHGESLAQFAPIEPRTVRLAMRFVAVCSDPRDPRYGQMGGSWEERLSFIEANVNEFMFRTQIGNQAGLGQLRLERTFTDFEHFPYGEADQTMGTQWCTGRFLSSSEAEVDRDARWAEYDLVFENPEGTWLTEQQEVRVDVPANADTAVDLPMGTAPVWDAMLAVRSADGRLEAGTSFKNTAGVGFELARWTESWWILDMESRMSSLAGTATGPNWGANLNDAQMISELGRPQGSALLVNPGVSSSGDRIGRITINAPQACQVRIRYNPRFF
ncbi:hypothetical protein Q7C18_02740 [Nesterenkonia sp. CL21]|uniref:hypothetical protein n=1 Tax=Nesterenkonia sp. CL21 TaxID=3064894 RepID=UPI00287980F5|nr:hypothetical protein [Nesterenkonia sp. CL21]MDS2171606.1 hypothetical protein [Nesterenkonia sp. CL21]